MQIKVENLSMIYSPGLPYETKALEDINFTVQQGEFLGIIGHTGSGKTTLVQCIAGLLVPTAGRIVAVADDGTETVISEKGKEAFRVRRSVGIVFQYPEYQLFEETVIKDVCFGPKNQGLSEAEQIERARAALDLVGINADEKGEVSPFELSGGQKRRVAIAGVLAMQPKYLVLDEPMAGLDPIGRKEILSLLEKLRQESGCTIIMISHSMDDIANHATKVLVLEKGSVFLYDTPQNVFAKADDIQRIGLSVPSITKICIEMNRKGAAIPTSICTEEAFLDWFREGKTHA